MTIHAISLFSVKSGAPPLWRWLRRGLLLLLGLVLLYGAGRLVHVALGSFYSGERGPYLQMPAPHAVTLRWQTATATIGSVRYGLLPKQLGYHVTEGRAGEEHALRLTGLQPNTLYYYVIEADGEPRYGGAEYWFITPPETGSTLPLRFAVLGDPGYANPKQLAVRDSMLEWLGAHLRSGRAYLDLLLTTGDNAYRSGSNEQFQTGFFDPYGVIFRNIVVWPIYGNHDARRWAFFELFDFPTQGESGGVASATEHYYSFDYGQVHFVVLDSQSSSMRPGSEMLQWLKKDLSQNRQPWTIAAFHHPPYTKGSHDSDNKGDSRGRMFAVRENVLPLLERAGVDLVLSGHSHMYERSHLLNCHYGTSDTLTPAMLKPSKEKNDGAVVYRKPFEQRNSGTIYAVVGSSSKVDNGSLDHPVMAVSLRQMGALVVDVSGTQLKARFVTDKGNVADSFTIIKDRNSTSAFPCDS